MLPINAKAELIIQSSEDCRERTKMYQHKENVQFIEISRAQVVKGKFMPMRQAVEGLGEKKRKRS